ncbi:undecaprenyl-diphosphatase [Pseudonocardia thermophila]|uniref:Undecaprenyl-diphosphatase n=1 Tax=Pseudonocardia thermophila TaxID=1848 RepID=A0A1M6R1J1_PSETH|nr:phosphatase PAP2 family protein [Pseudonocardia thermophila]SHK26256.1 undecaprenyl-diphosphatase [Pseudonocardia thermophila]
MRTGRWVTAAVVALVLVAGAALWAAATGVGPAGADAAALREAVSVRTPALTTVAVLITNAGGTWAMTALACLAGIALWFAGRRADAVFVAAATGGAAAAFSGLKRVLDRPRPPEATRLVVETNESLPSGHATMSIVVIGSLVVVGWAGRSASARVLMVLAAVVWAGLVGLTRIYLGVHWFSDVVAGWAVGAAWLAVCVVAWMRWRA